MGIEQLKTPDNSTNEKSLVDSVRESIKGKSKNELQMRLNYFEFMHASYINDKLPNEDIAKQEECIKIIQEALDSQS